jgi:hypothetical protein
LVRQNQLLFSLVCSPAGGGQQQAAYQTPSFASQQQTYPQQYYDQAAQPSTHVRTTATGLNQPQPVITHNGEDASYHQSYASTQNSAIANQNSAYAQRSNIQDYSTVPYPSSMAPYVRNK